MDSRVQYETQLQGWKHKVLNTRIELIVYVLNVRLGLSGPVDDAVTPAREIDDMRGVHEGLQLVSPGDG